MYCLYTLITEILAFIIHAKTVVGGRQWLIRPTSPLLLLRAIIPNGAMGSFKFEVCKTLPARSVTASAQSRGNRGSRGKDDRFKLAVGNLLYSCLPQTKRIQAQLTWLQLAASGDEARGRTVRM